MEQAENFEQLIKRTAEELTMADHVYYDLDSLKYGVMFESPFGMRSRLSETDIRSVAFGLHLTGTD